MHHSVKQQCRLESKVYGIRRAFFRSTGFHLNAKCNAKFLYRSIEPAMIDTIRDKIEYG